MCPETEAAAPLAPPTSVEELASRTAAVAVAVVDALRRARKQAEAEGAADDEPLEARCGRQRNPLPAKSDPLKRPKFALPVKINDRKFYRRSEIDFFKDCLEAVALGRPLPPKPPPPPGDPLVPHRKVALEFSTTERTTDRWVFESRTEE